jgi:hypothetical protein
MLAAVAALWLLRAGETYRLAECEKIALAVLFLLSLNPRSVSEMTQLPIGPLATLGFAAFVATHVVRARTTAARGVNGKPVPRPVASLRFARSGQ